MESVKISGVGIHSGRPANLVVRSSKSGGIVFIRGRKKVPAKYDQVTNTSLRNTTIGSGKSEIQTIEHLMAALYICRIANAEINTDNKETPILDGSAAEFISALKNLERTGNLPYLVVKKEISASQKEIIKKLPFVARMIVRIVNLMRGYNPNGVVRLLPTNKKELNITVQINHKEPIIGNQRYSFVFDYNNFKKSAQSFISEVAKARTFGKVGEWEWLKKRGMGLGANEYNVIALGKIGEFEKLKKLGIGRNIDTKKIVSVGEKYDAALTGLHYPDEFVRHKIIDVVGDLYTSGFNVIAKVDSFKGGHALHNLILRKLFSNPENYDIIKP